MGLVKPMGDLRGTVEHLVMISVKCGCLKTLLANRRALVNKYPSFKRKKSSSFSFVPKTSTYPLNSAEGMMWFNFYVCMDVYCTGMSQNVMTRMSETISTWKHWSKTPELVCQACWWQAPHLHQHRLNHLQDSTNRCRYLRALHPCVMDTTEVTKFVCRRLSFVSLLQRSLRGPLNLADTETVMQNLSGLCKATTLPKRGCSLSYVQWKGRKAAKDKETQSNMV